MHLDRILRLQLSCNRLSIIEFPTIKPGNATLQLLQLMANQEANHLLRIKIDMDWFIFLIKGPSFKMEAFSLLNLTICKHIRAVLLKSLDKWWQRFKKWTLVAWNWPRMQPREYDLLRTLTITCTKNPHLVFVTWWVLRHTIRACSSY